jgi:hypothetical protein
LGLSTLGGSHFWRYQHATLKSRSVYMLTIVVLPPGWIRGKSFLEHKGQQRPKPALITFPAGATPHFI